ncbi:MAG: hypothetical protein LBP82_02440, partial [Candidatus Methanoplasma sp.]|nr:hypothetical protein [Candidatus Methanoplasma sp.]
SFSAAAGYIITDVFVDGSPLSQEQIDLGLYRFINVMANHLIDVRASSAMILEVRIIGGDGYVEYSMDGRATFTYTIPVPMKRSTYLILKAFPESGYEFKEWRTPMGTYNTEEISLMDIQTSLYIELHLSSAEADDGMDWVKMIIIALLAVLAALFFLFFLLYRKTYEVVKVASSATIIGKDKARRKRSYVFRIEGGAVGNVAYKVGDGGEWKAMSPREDGKYVIPRKDVIDMLTIEVR